MKKLYVLASVLMFLYLPSCSGGNSGNSQGNETATRELSLNQTLSGEIGAEGEVDWYHYRVVEANNLLQVDVSSNTYRPDVELLVSVFELDEEGNKLRLYAEHTPEDSLLPADIKMNIYVDAPKDIYISVRDLMDDEASENPYYLTINFAGSSDGNNNFGQATALIVDDQGGCQNDNIGYVGDVDVYRFSAPRDGVYAVDVVFSPFSGGTDVELSIDLYDGQGTLVQSLSRSQGNHYRLLPYLPSGEYYVLIDDNGRDDFDTASPYEICVESVEVSENNQNDVMENASSMAYDSSIQTFAISASLEYWDDKDWYALPVQNITTAGFKVLKVSFDDGEVNQYFNFQINLVDASGNSLLSHNFTGGSSEYQAQIKVGENDHYLLIQPPEGRMLSDEASYTVSVQVMDVDDPAELVVKVQGIGNDTIDTADVLTPSANPDNFTIAMIGYRGDEDWYSISVNDTTKPQVLEVFLDTDSNPSSVDYSLSIMRDSVVKKVFDTNGEDGGTELKTSILIPSMASQTSVTYYLKVCDYQGDDGDGTTPYRIRANLSDIPSSLPVDSNIDPGEVIYHSEDSEIADETSETINMEHNSLTRKAYDANTTLLDFNILNPVNGITKTKNADSTTTITFPWIAGYIDFEGDQDFFKLDFGPLSEEGVALDSRWYYEIQIDLHVDNPGSSTEYVWKLYRDRNNNQLLVDRQRDSNGFFASAGDPDTDKQAFDITTPAQGTDQRFWVGDAWEGGFYLSIGDFNYINSVHPDDDWGYDGAPYYFKLTLIYHPGESYPE